MTTEIYKQFEIHSTPNELADYPSKYCPNGWITKFDKVGFYDFACLIEGNPICNSKEEADERYISAAKRYIDELE